MSSRYRFSLLALIVLAVLASFLYVPFLSNGLIFDDHGLFATGAVYDYAQVPFNFSPRTFPYFTLGFFSVVSSGLEVNRIVSLALHILCGWMLYLLLMTLLGQIWKVSDLNENDKKQAEGRATVLAFLGATWFLIHPIAVYGAGYLAQRTILFATLFSLLSLWFYRRAFAENRTADIVTAAFFYSTAVFSKEHAIMLPLVAVMLTAIYEGDFRSNFKRITLYLVLCFPAAVTVLLAAKHIVATSYEPDVGAMIPRMHGIALLAESGGQWIVSIVMQAGFFFDYLGFWFVPDVRFLSVDMRFDFVHIWSSWWVFPKAFLFFLSPLLAIYFLRKKGLMALFCCGFLYCWFLFLTELAAVRFQEPFVLYRSYLWAPGYVMMMVAICARFSRRWLVIAAIPVFVIFFLLARERLTSLATEASVWKDAASKLVSPSFVGSDRIFYNRGRAYLREKRYAEAIADFSRTIQQSPQVSSAYFNRALAYYSLGKYSETLSDLDHALLLNKQVSDSDRSRSKSPNKQDGSIQYVRGLVFEQRDCIAAALHAYSVSVTLGNQVAKLKLEDLTKKGAVLRSRKSPLDNTQCP